MTPVLLLISERGLNARALGDPAVYGPVARLVAYQKEDCGSSLTRLVHFILLLGLCIVGSVRCEFRWRRIAGVVVCNRCQCSTLCDLSQPILHG